MREPEGQRVPGWGRTSSGGAVTPAVSSAPGFEWERKELGWLCIFPTRGAPCAPCPSAHLGYLTSSFPLWVPANTRHLSLARWWSASDGGRPAGRTHGAPGSHNAGASCSGSMDIPELRPSHFCSPRG